MSAVFADLVDLVCHETVGLFVNRVGVFGVPGFDKTEDLPCALVYPVPEVTNPILLLGLQICHVGFGDIRSGDPALNVVDIHEK